MIDNKKKRDRNADKYFQKELSFAITFVGDCAFGALDSCICESA